MPDRARKFLRAEAAVPDEMATAGPGLIHPLDEFYADAGIALPPWQAMEGAAVPAPYRKLLVHQTDMTPTLEEFYRRPMHLRVLSRRRKGHLYYREVVLIPDGGEQPVEFGAIKMQLDLLAPEPRRHVLEEIRPLGAILRDCAVVHQSDPQGYIRIASDKLINQALELTGANVLYGRRNTLRVEQGRPLAEIVEILPPVRSEDRR